MATNTRARSCFIILAEADFIYDKKSIFYQHLKHDKTVAVVLVAVVALLHVRCHREGSAVFYVT